MKVAILGRTSKIRSDATAGRPGNHEVIIGTHDPGKPRKPRSPSEGWA